MKFDGVEYYASGWKRTKKEAQASADWIRSRGGLARVVRERNGKVMGYGIYRRGGH